MMKNPSRTLIAAATAAILVTACATPGEPPPQMEMQPIPSGKYEQKVDYLYFLLDASSSMKDGYEGQNKFATARSVISNFNETMPDVNTTVALRSFGHNDEVSNDLSVLMTELTMYSSDALPSGLERVDRAGGTSPLKKALKETRKDLKGVSAPTALVIVSDGRDMGRAPLTTATNLQAAHSSNLCIYTVLVGNDYAGRNLLADIADASGCGQAVTADSLATGASMNKFVKEVLLGGLLDSDGDGVPDYLDECPDTPRGVEVDEKGCPFPVPTQSAEVTPTGTWIYKDIQFALNKADLRESSLPVLDEIVAGLKSQPSLSIEIQGHTDSTGAHDYNIDLSKRRAESVKDYLVANGIDGGRLTTVGYGPDQPIASNDTQEGRAKNRRVEVKPIQ